MSMGNQNEDKTMRGDGDKRESAMRLFEAFSGVDPKYLEACENAGASEGKVVPFAGLAAFNRRYGSYVAAALVLFVLGVGVLGWNSSMRSGSNSTMQADIAPSALQAEQQIDGEARKKAETAADEIAAGTNSGMAVSGAYAETAADTNAETAEMYAPAAEAEKGMRGAAQSSGNKEEVTNDMSDAAMTSGQGRPQRMLMVNGQLYVDTGYVSGIWGRCGNLDGNIESVTATGEIPTKDGEANFEAVGWQTGAEKDTIEVPIDDEWCIFAVQGSKPEGYIPASVLQFMATVEEVTTDGYMIVRTNFGVGELFRGKIKEDTLYKLSLEHYEPGIYTDTPVTGNVVVIVCKNKLEGTNPQLITEVYHISPVGSNVMQRAE